MTAKEFENHHKSRPFNPFTIHLSGGMRYDVPTPEYVAHRPGGRHCYVLNLRGPGHAIIDLEHVTRITFEEAALTADFAD